MGHFTVQKNGEDRVYKDGGKLVETNKVPTNTKKTLEEARAGTVVDETGAVVDPSTESDEGSGEEQAPKQDEVNNENQQDDDLDDDESLEDAQNAQAQNSQATPKQQKRARKAQADDDDDTDEGMGFPRKDGKTLSVFSNKPHQTVKFVQGLMVPMTHEEYETKTDSDIIDALKKLKKIA